MPGLQREAIAVYLGLQLFERAVAAEVAVDTRRRRRVGQIGGVRIDGAKLVLQLANVNELCSDVVELLTEQAKGKQVALELEPDEALGEVEIDESALRRCLMNLVGNAVDACEPEVGLVTLKTVAKGEDRFVISIRDNGCGIEPARLEKIFDPFYSTKGGKGTGLGLAVTKKIVEEHSGVLHVASKPGEGTEFILELPVKEPEAESAET